jgi:hypothetical protein
MIKAGGAQIRPSEAVSGIAVYIGCRHIEAEVLSLIMASCRTMSKCKVDHYDLATAIVFADMQLPKETHVAVP